jgi:beta-phosphoglucomutase-like phosphatase (HAD superfamily)
MIGALDAIIFDFDGVIADSERLHLRAYQDVLAPLGATLSNDEYYSTYLGYDDRGMLRTFATAKGLEWDETTLARLIAMKGERYETLAAQGEMLFPGAAEFVREAAGSVPIAIASGALTHEIEETLDRAGLRRCFTAIVGADQTMRSKPSPDPYLEALHRIVSAGHAVDASRTVAIEDSRWGLVSADTAKLRTVAVATTYTARELEPFAELVVTGLSALTLSALDVLCQSAPRGKGITVDELP